MNPVSYTHLAKKVLIEKNTFHSPASRYLHDVYEIAECPFRTPIHREDNGKLDCGRYSSR